MASRVLSAHGAMSRRQLLARRSPGLNRRPAGNRHLQRCRDGGGRGKPGSPFQQARCTAADRPLHVSGRSRLVQLRMRERDAMRPPALCLHVARVWTLEHRCACAALLLPRGSRGMPGFACCTRGSTSRGGGALRCAFCIRCCACAGIASWVTAA
eukprot:363664-Chlamydomonas_euryale.AAC.23